MGKEKRKIMGQCASCVSPPNLLTETHVPYMRQDPNSPRLPTGQQSPEIETLKARIILLQTQLHKANVQVAETRTQQAQHLDRALNVMQKVLSQKEVEGWPENHTPEGWPN